MPGDPTRPIFHWIALGLALGPWGFALSPWGFALGPWGVLDVNMLVLATRKSRVSQAQHEPPTPGGSCCSGIKIIGLSGLQTSFRFPQF